MSKVIVSSTNIPRPGSSGQSPQDNLSTKEWLKLILVDPIELDADAEYGTAMTSVHPMTRSIGLGIVDVDSNTRVVVMLDPEAANDLTANFLAALPALLNSTIAEYTKRAEKLAGDDQ